MTQTMTRIEAPRDAADTPHRPMPVSVQIVSTLLFGGFAIAAVAIAFTHFWPAGVALAVILGWRGGFAPLAAPRGRACIETRLEKLAPEAELRQSGNASFDAYRGDVLRRLEDERGRFESFLGRLREAKDQTEFDRFMDERAQRSGQN